MDKELHNDLEKLVDVCDGKMTIPELQQEIIRYAGKLPEIIVITMEKRRDDFGKTHYHSTIYITPEDFKKKC